MKNASIIFNFILAAAVLFLFYKQYAHKDAEQNSVPMKPIAPSAIVFVNSDTLLDNYDFFKQMKSALEKKQDSIDAVLKSRGNALQGEIESYQKRGATMSEQDRAKEEERLGKKQQDVMQFKQEMTDEFRDQEAKMNDVLHTHLITYLKKYNKNKNYEFILGYQKGGGILLANDSLDITRQVIEGINKEKEEK